MAARKKATARQRGGGAPGRSARPSGGSTATQDLYTGMSGQFVAMSEFLWRGYNVAIPAVDVGEDIFVVEAGNGELRRVQVKTAATDSLRKGVKTVQFNLSRGQLRVPTDGGELFFMLLTRWDDVDPKMPWRFILIRGSKLNELRLDAPAEKRRGRRPLLDNKTANSKLVMHVGVSASDAIVWGHSLRDYLDRWSEDWPVAGPMKKRLRSSAISPAAPLT